MDPARAGSFPAGWGDTDDKESIRALHAALDMGINFFDTAANYGAGHSEVLLGQAFKGKRDKVVIATKFGHIVNEEKKTVYSAPDQIIPNVRTDVENSLRRLQTDYIDIYQLHEGRYDSQLSLELQDILEELVSAGRSAGMVGARMWLTMPAHLQVRRTALIAHPFNSD